MILFRYITKEHILPFFYALSILIFISVMDWAIQLIDKILSKGLSPSVVFEIFLISLAWMIVTAVPMAILISTLMVFGRMSADNEIVAVKASGSNVYFLITPIFCAGLLIAALLMLFNDLILPDANHRAASLLADISRKKPQAIIEPGIIIRDFPGYALYVGDMDPRSGAMRNVLIFSDVANDDPSTTVADSGSIAVTGDGRFLQLILFSGVTHRQSREKNTEFATIKFDRQVVMLNNIDSEFKRSDREYRGDREMTIAMMQKDIDQYNKRNYDALKRYQITIDTLDHSIIRLDSLSHVYGEQISRTGDSTTTFSGWLSQYKMQPGHLASNLKLKLMSTDNVARSMELEQINAAKLIVEVQKKYAIPVACIVFVLIGAPLGIMARRGGIAAGASYSLFFFIIYWVCLIGGETLADKGKLDPVLAMWSGNIIVGICGLLLVFLMMSEKNLVTLLPITFIKHALANSTSWLRGNNRHKRKTYMARVLALPGKALQKITGILPAYLIRIFLNNLVGVLLGLLLVFSVIDYISNLRRFEGATLHQVILSYWYYTPWLVQTFLPIIILLASMFSMGSLAKNSELTAMRASGVGIYRLSWPLLLLGVLIAVSSFAGGEYILPRANGARADLMRSIAEGKQGPQSAKDLRRNFYYFANKGTVYVCDEFRADPQLARTVTRTRFIGGSISQNVTAEQLVYENKRWFFVNGFTRKFDDLGAIITPFDTLVDSTLNVTPIAMTKRIKSADEMSYWEISYYIDKARSRGENVQKYIGEKYFKVALPVMNIIVILLGISITARSGRSGSAVLFGIGLMLTFTYWVICRFALAFGQNGYLPPMLGAWIGNIIFLMLALFLFKRASQ